MRPAISSRSLPMVQPASKPHNLAHSEEEGTTLAKDSTPYRLPKIARSQPLPRSPRTRGSSREQSSQDRLYEIDYICSDRIEKYLRKRKKLPGPPNTIAQLQRQEGIHMPTFQSVNIEPVFFHNRVDDCTGDSAPGHTTRRTSLSTRDTQALSSLSKQVADRLLEDTPRADKHTAWRLSPHQHKNYDVQAIRGQTGPFSRDFIIHCNTPNSWLRMKHKRHKTSP